MKRMFAVVAIAVMWWAYAPPVVAHTTTDQSDLWWIPAESGWGIQFVQQETTIFATMFVYGANGQPTWYVATMDVSPGTLKWSGALYATTGPWFGAVPFDPAMVTATPVGTMTFDGTLIQSGTLTYSVNGVQVMKSIVRETLKTIDFNGSYSGVLSQQGTGASCLGSANTASTPVSFRIVETAGSSASITSASEGGTCTFLGTYTQSGHFGRIAGNYTCSSGDAGAFKFFEMAMSYYEMRARTQLISQSGCTLNGYMVGLVQPPPP